MYVTIELPFPRFFVERFNKKSGDYHAQKNMKQKTTDANNSLRSSLSTFVHREWKHLFTLTLTVFLAIFLRSFWLADAPKGALIDEAHFGYLAWSILTTGKDEHSVSYPLNFKGFGDDKLPLQVYAMVPVVKLFGVNTQTIRYPSIIAGTLLVICAYGILRRLKFNHEWSAFGALITAVSPWTFILSRFGFESNLALCFFALGLYFLYTYTRYHKRKNLLLSAVFFGISWYAYIAYRPITLSLLIASLGIFVYSKTLSWKNAILTIIVFFVTILPLFQPSVIGNNSTRVSQVGIFSDPILSLEVNEFRNFCSFRIPISTFCSVAANKYVVASKMLASRFLDTYSPDFLATRGERSEQFLTVENYGQFFSVLYPFFIVGIAILLLNKEHHIPQSARAIVLLGLLLCPVPSILAGDPQKVRISALFPFVLVTIMIGLHFCYNAVLKPKHLVKISAVVFFALFTLQTFQFYINWFAVHSQKNGYMYQSYLPRLFDYLSTLDPSSRIVIRPFFSDPLMFYAFYTHVPPAEYQKLAVLGEKESSGFQHTVELGNVSAREVSLGEVGCSALSSPEQSYFVTQEDIQTAKKVFTVYSENGVDPRVFVYDAKLSVDPKTCSH